MKASLSGNNDICSRFCSISGCWDTTDTGNSHQSSWWYVVVRHIPITLLAHGLHRCFTLIKMNTSPTTDNTITNCCRRRAAELQHRVTAVTFHLWHNEGEDSCPTRQWRSICCQREKPTRPFDSMLDWNQMPMGNVIKLLREKELLPHWEAEAV